MKIPSIFDKSIKTIAYIIFLWIIVLLLFFENRIDYYFKREFSISNLIMVLIGIFIIGVSLFFKNKKKIKKHNIDCDKIVLILLLLFFIAQIYIFYNIYFETGWDVGVVVDSARDLVLGKRLQDYILNYFSIYPNNVLITIIHSYILKINSIIGLFSSDYDLMSIITVNCLISSCSSYLVYKIGKQLFNKKIAFIGYLVSVFLFVFSPWNVICYSDSFTILFPILMIYLYMNKKIKYYFKFPIILFLGYLVYLIKPQSIIVVIAIIMVEIIKHISSVKKEFIKKGIIIIIPSILLIILSNILINKIYAVNQIELNDEKRMGVTHYLMMGINEEYNGTYFDDDLVYSMNIPTRKERKEKNLEVFKNRMEKYGVGGYFKLLSKKLLSAYNDGSFAWQKEGEFFNRTKDTNSQISNELKSIYYGENYVKYSTVIHFVWINTIMIIAINIISSIFKKNKRIDYYYLIILLTIVGITLFELIFEVRARYLYSNVPIFVLLMMYGLYDLSKIELNKLVWLKKIKNLK